MRTLVIDALYLNWALPAGAVPPAPGPLSYQVCPWDGGDWVFLSALLFRNRGVHFERAPFFRLSYPQLDLRLYAEDADGVPSVLSLGVMLPRWVRPAVALAARRPVSGAHFDFPSPSLDPAGESWSWSVEQGKRLEVVARRGAGLRGRGPGLGSWEQTVRFFRDRPRTYVDVGGRLQRIDSQHPRVAVWPLAAEVTDGSLLTELMPLADGSAWPPLHSAWLCPEIPAVFDLRLVPDVPLEAAMPTPAVRPCARSMRRPARWPTGRAAL
ncbi:MAG TPA: DUF2071 domain-containing protein [Thermoanaerobaculia bacterium]|nr:DUF2071 domain-containing protein [Thermoanaerobaculia bacterium]